MSTLKTNNVQVGQSVTATNNFTIYQPATPDGTVRIGVGNSGATTGDAVTINSTGIVSGTLISSTAVTASGTSVDFTGIPSTAKRVTVMFDQVSTNGTSNMQIQLGTSSGVQATSYNAAWSYNGPGNSGAAITTGFGIFHNSAGDNKSGSVSFSLFNNNIWVGFGGFANLGAQPGYTMFTSGSKSLGATLDRIRVTTVNGTDTFDAGTINIMWEG